MNIAKKVAKDGVHACVLRIFFAALFVSSLDEIVVATKKKQLFGSIVQTEFCFFVFF